MNHALTIDVEDSFNICMNDLFGIRLPPSADVVRNTENLLGLMQKVGVRGTFFVLGEVALCYPSLVKRISTEGHEVGVHGFYHTQFFRTDPKTAYEALRSTKQNIEDITGCKVFGHRAPAFSIRPDTAWALETLAEVGFEYDSSIMPCKGRRYGWPGFAKDIVEVELKSGAKIIEAPLPTIALFGKAVPVCGGGYLRHFPTVFTRWAMGRLKGQRPVIIYLHPYDIDLEPMPKAFQKHLEKAGAKVKWHMKLQTRNRCTVEPKLRELLHMANFVPLVEVIANVLAS